MLRVLSKARVELNAQRLSEVGFSFAAIRSRMGNVGYGFTLAAIINTYYHDDRSPTHPTRPPRRASAPHVLAAVAVCVVVLSSGITCPVYVFGRESVLALLELHNG